MADTQDIWALLEKDAPMGCAAVQDLYSWSLNYDAGKGPWSLFVDLIGWSEDEYGEKLYQGDSLGFVELDKLGLALREYANAPNDVSSYVSAIDAASVAS